MDNTSYSILHWLELKSFHFAQFFLKCSSSSWTLKKWELRTFWEDFWNQVMESWSVNKLMFVYKGPADCWKNLQIENQSLSCYCWSLYGFQTSDFICYQFRGKFWLQSIQNHAWHSFVLCKSNLGRLPFLRQVPLPQAGCQYRSAALHRTQFRTWRVVPMSWFYLHTNDWLKGWAKQW